MLFNIINILCRHNVPDTRFDMFHFNFLMKAPIRLVVSGAAGQIAYSAIFKIFDGQVFGKDQPVHLVMLEVTPALKACEGVVMEAEDCAFPCYAGITVTDDPKVAFKGAHYACLFGAFPRGPGMERVDLMTRNKGIFELQGKAMNEVCDPDIRVLVVGNPANTNACVLRHFATRVKPGNITAMSRLDHNRLVGQIALKLNVSPGEVKDAFVVGNHSNTMVPMICMATVNGVSVQEQVDEKWIKDTMALIRSRGAAVINARGGKSSAASAAVAALDHLHDWHLGTSKIVSASIEAPAKNIYNVPEGIFSSFPCTCENGVWKIANLPFCKGMEEEVQRTIDDLVIERKMAFGEM